MEISNTDGHYLQVLENLKAQIHTARMQAAVMLNNHVLRLYWEIGQTIVREQKVRGWGAKVIDELSKDLRREFPDFKGLSPRNLHYMKTFALNYPDVANFAPIGAKLPWRHICLLMDKVKDAPSRDFYAAKTVEGGWSRAVLEAQIESGLIHRVGKAITNFETTLPPEYSDLARQTLKNPYAFGFLSIEGKMHERDLEAALIQKITHFLLELGTWLRINKPIGVSTFHFSKTLPVAYKAILPSVEALEKRLELEIQHATGKTNTNLLDI